MISVNFKRHLILVSIHHFDVKADEDYYRIQENFYSIENYILVPWILAPHVLF